MTGLPQVLPLTRAIARPLQGPSLGPAPLVMDFRNPASVDGQYTFTRASGGGRFNAQGQYEWLPANEPRIDFDPVTGECRGLLIEESRTNLVGNSGQISLWTKGGGPVGTVPRAAVAPDGTLTACSFTFGADYQYLLGSLSTATAGTAYCASVFVKKGTGRFVLRISTTDSVQTVKARIDSVAGTITALGGSGGSTNLGTFKLPAGPDYDRYAVVGSFATTSSLTSIMLVREAATDVGGTVWGAQLEQGTFPTSYIPTPAIFTGRASTGTYFDADGVLRIAAAGEARYTHAYIDGKWVSAGLLLEESRTNLLTHSSDLSQWSLFRLAQSFDDGGIRLTETAENGGHVCLRIMSFSAGAAYTLSVELKASNRYVRLMFPASAFTSQIGASFNLTGGTVAGAVSPGVTAAITPSGNGRYVCSISAVATATASGNADFRLSLPDFNTAYMGDGVSSVVFYRAQLEQGSFPTSYIPTTTAQVTRAADTSTSSQVTRAADMASVNELSPWYNASEGTLFVEASTFVPPTTGVVATFYAALQDGTSNVMGIYRSSLPPGRTGLWVVKDGVQVIDMHYGVAVPANTVAKAAMTYDATTVRTAFNGSGGPSASTAPPIPTKLNIGGRQGAPRSLNGHVQRIEYYPRRLSNTELQEITA